MKPVFSFLFFILIFGCRPKTPDSAPFIPPSPSVGTVVPGSGTTPVILEAQVEGIGKALISGRSIIVKVPAGFTSSTIRIDYKVSEGVKTMIPASGTEVSVRDLPSRTVCIQQDASGNCTLSYRLVIEVQSPLTVSADPASLQLELNQFQQSYELTFRLGNLKTDAEITRQFQIRFVNKATKFTHTGENYMVYDLAGQPLYVNQLNQPATPNEGKLKMTGMLPLGMSAGEYTVTIQVPTCYAPSPDGGCYSFGYESVELTTPLILKAGAPVVGLVSAMPSATKEVVITGRNFTPAKTVTVRLTSDFTPALTAQATVLNDTLARLVLPSSQPVGQYALEALAEGGKSLQTLFAIPPAKPSPSFAYVASFGSYAANRNWLPALPVFKRGESLEVRYTFTTAASSYSEAINRTVKQVRLVSTTDSKLTYALQEGGAFRPFSLATDFFMWKWTLPNTLSAGEYALVFEDFDGALSLPFYQKIRVE